MRKKVAAPKIKIKLKRSQRLTKIGQIIYLTCTNFGSNNLLESASACSFGFIFSFVPLALIIFTVLVGIIRVSPGILEFVNAFGAEIESIVDIRPFINNILNKKNFHFFDIFLGVWIIWMARKMFLSIIRAMAIIFKTDKKRRGILNQAMMFISEFILVIVIAAIIIFMFGFNQLVSANYFEPLREYLPAIVNQNSHTIVSFAMYFVIFVFTFFAYRVLSSTKPPMFLCFIYGLLDSLCFYFISNWVTKFMNLTNYNIVYGTISTIIVLMMKVYFFFIFFLFFAQMIYVTQYFELLLKCEVYLLPDSEHRGWMVKLRRMLFINPAALKTATNTKTIQQGEVIFNADDKADSVYYIRIGTITEQFENGESQIYEKGSFVGDTLCLLDERFRGTGVASKDCKLIIFSAVEFKELMKSSQKAASKALSKLAEI
ncbi:MAG: YihY/virulence factor BrkB family protein [Treponema sp.]|nr:YihY/virulence factor BrkB family protein [Treponema sp.]